MASFQYAAGIAEQMNGVADLDAGGTDMRAILVMTNTTCDTTFNATTWASFATPDVYDGVNHPATGFTLTGKATTKVDAGGPPNDYTTFDADDWTLTSLGPGTRSAQAAIIIRWTGTLNGSIPYAYIDGTGFPFAGDGGNRTIVWNALGIFRNKQA